jgi:hypothetical protein
VSATDVTLVFGHEYDFDAGQGPLIPTAWTELARSAEFRYRAENLTS